MLVGISHPANPASSVTMTRWAIVHFISCAMCSFGMLGVAGLYARQAKQVGWIGLIGYVFVQPLAGADHGRVIRLAPDGGEHLSP